MATKQSLARGLKSLAKQINTEHARAERDAKSAIGHALECGRSLIEAKAKVKHGEWVPWLEANCTVKPRQAQQYMRLADNWSTIESKSAPGAHLAIKSALRFLTAEDSSNGEETDLAEPDDEEEDDESEDEDSDDEDGKEEEVDNEDGDSPDETATNNDVQPSASPKPKYPLSIGFCKILGDIVAALNLVREDHQTLAALLTHEKFDPRERALVTNMVNSLKQTFTEWDKEVRDAKNIR